MTTSSSVRTKKCSDSHSFVLNIGDGGEYLSGKRKRNILQRETGGAESTSTDEIAVWVDVHVSAGCWEL